MTQSSFSRSISRGHHWLVTFCSLALLLAGYLGSAQLGSAQTAVILSPVPRLQFFDNNGKPLAFGCVFSYQSGTTTPLATYTDYTGSTQNTNPLILGSDGRVGTGGMWLGAGLAYRLDVKSAGKTNCALGSTISTVNGIGGGSTVLTTVVPFSTTPTFTDASQIQLFQIVLSANATAQPMTFVGVTPPGIIFFHVIQDGSGGHSFSWPANTVGGCPVAQPSNFVSTQEFVYDGTLAYAVGPCVTGGGPALSAGSLALSGLTASLPVCTDANKFLSSTCTGLIPNSALANSSVTYNGQTVALGASGNVNAGDTAHSIALNEGNGSQLAGVTLTNDQDAIGRTSADPVATSLCTGSLAYSTSTHAYSCTVDQWVTTSGCSASGSPCTVSTNWPSSFADTSYFVECTATSEASNSIAAFWVSTKNTGSFVISIDNRGTNATGGFGSFDCHGHHN
jgi:hypothetical protein